VANCIHLDTLHQRAHWGCEVLTYQKALSKLRHPSGNHTFIPVQVSVVVPAFNEEKLIGATLRSIQVALGPFTRAGWQTQLLVCNNNSTDRTAELAAAAGAGVVFEPVNQIARARNTGAAAATGDWLIFVDADSQPSPELFADVLNAINTGNVLAGGVTVRMEGNYPIAGALVKLWNGLSRLRKWAAGSFIFCEAGAFRAVGGFNQDLYASEEIFLFKKLKKKARADRKRIVILNKHPLLTSARKMHLYTPAEHLKFLARTVLQFGGTLKDPKECPTWYDGRR
jgi:glycosyltransferase involved in cell wall biosynthesis